MKFIIMDFKGNKKIIDFDEIDTRIIYDKKYIALKLYRNKKLILDTKITEYNYIKFSKVLYDKKYLDEIVCLMLNDDNTFIEETKIVNINKEDI